MRADCTKSQQGAACRVGSTLYYVRVIAETFFQSVRVRLLHKVKNTPKIRL